MPLIFISGLPPRAHAIHETITVRPHENHLHTHTPSRTRKRRGLNTRLTRSSFLPLPRGGQRFLRRSLEGKWRFSRVTRVSFHSLVSYPRCCFLQYVNAITRAISTDRGGGETRELEGRRRSINLRVGGRHRHSPATFPCFSPPLGNITVRAACCCSSVREKSPSLLQRSSSFSFFLSLLVPARRKNNSRPTRRMSSDLATRAHARFASYVPRNSIPKLIN